MLVVALLDAVALGAPPASVPARLASLTAAVLVSVLAAGRGNRDFPARAECWDGRIPSLHPVPAAPRLVDEVETPDAVQRSVVARPALRDAALQARWRRRGRDTRLKDAAPSD
jgi:hypothetical protein